MLLLGQVGGLVDAVQSVAASFGQFGPLVGAVVLWSAGLAIGEILGMRQRRADRARFRFDRSPAGRVAMATVAEFPEAIWSLEEARTWWTPAARLNSNIFRSHRDGVSSDPASVVWFDDHRIRFSPAAEAYTIGWDGPLRRLGITPTDREQIGMGYRYITAYLLGRGLVEEVFRSIRRDLTPQEEERFAKTWALWSVAVHLKRAHRLDYHSPEQVLDVLTEALSDSLSPGHAPYSLTELTGILEWANRLTAAENALMESAIARSATELDEVVEGMGRSRAERGTLRRELKRGLDRRWGRRGLDHRNMQVRDRVRAVVQDLAAWNELSGVGLSESELIERATRLAHWASATAAYESRGWRGSRVDVGARVRADVADAFAQSLPESLRAVLADNGLDVHAIWSSVDRPGPDAAAEGPGRPGGGEAVVHLLSPAERLRAQVGHIGAVVMVVLVAPLRAIRGMAAAHPRVVRAVVVLGLAVALVVGPAVPAAAAPLAAVAGDAVGLGVGAVTFGVIAFVVSWAVVWKRVWGERASPRDGPPAERFRLPLVTIVLASLNLLTLLSLGSYSPTLLAVATALSGGWVVALAGLFAARELTSAQLDEFRSQVAPVVAVAGALLSEAWVFGLNAVQPVDLLLVFVAPFLGMTVGAISVAALLDQVIVVERREPSREPEAAPEPETEPRGEEAGKTSLPTKVRDALAPHVGGAGVADLPDGQEGPASPSAPADPGEGARAASDDAGTTHETRSRKVDGRHVIPLDAEDSYDDSGSAGSEPPHGALSTVDVTSPKVVEALGAALEELHAEGKGWVHEVLPPDAGALDEGQVLFLVLPGVLAGRLAQRAGLPDLEAEEVVAGLLGYGFTAGTGAGVIASTTVAWLDAGARGVRHLVVEHEQREIRGEFEGRPDEHEQDRRRIVDAFQAGRRDDGDRHAAFWLDESNREDVEAQLRRRYQLEVLRGIVHQLRAEPEARTDAVTRSFLAFAERILVQHLIAVGRVEDAWREFSAVTDYLTLQDIADTIVRMTWYRGEFGRRARTADPVEVRESMERLLADAPSGRHWAALMVPLLDRTLGHVDLGYLQGLVEDAERLSREDPVYPDGGQWQYVDDAVEVLRKATGEPDGARGEMPENWASTLFDWYAQSALRVAPQAELTSERGARDHADTSRDDFLARSSDWVEDVIWHVTGTPDHDRLPGVRDAGGRIDDAVRSGLDAGATRARVLGVIATVLNQGLRRSVGEWRGLPEFDASRIALPLSTQARAWMVVGSAPATGPMPAWLWEHAVAVLRELAAAQPDEHTAPWRRGFLRVVGEALRRPLPVDEIGMVLGLPRGALSQDVRRVLALEVLRATPPGVGWKLRWAELTGASLRSVNDLVAVWTDPTLWRYQDLLDEVFRRLPVDGGAVDALLAFRAVPPDSPIAAWLELVGAVRRFEAALRAFDLTRNAQEMLQSLVGEIGDRTQDVARATVKRTIDDLQALFHNAVLRGRTVADLNGLFARWPADPVLAELLTEYVQVLAESGDTTAAYEVARKVVRHRLDVIPGGQPVGLPTPPQESIVSVGDGLVRVGVIEDLAARVGLLRDSHGYLPEDAAALLARDWIGVWRWEPGRSDLLLAYVMVERTGQRMSTPEVHRLPEATPDIDGVLEEFYRPDDGGDLHAGLLPLLLFGPAGGLFGAVHAAGSLPGGVMAVAAVMGGLGVALVAAWWWGAVQAAAGGRSTRAPPVSAAAPQTRNGVEQAASRTRAVVAAFQRWARRGVSVFIGAVLFGALGSGFDPAAAQPPPVAGLTSSVSAASSSPTEVTAASRSTGAGMEVRGERPKDVLVQWGDSRSRLVAALGVSEDALVAANPDLFPPGADRDHVEAGWRLEIPEGWNGRWTVQPGDNMSRIAGALGVELDALVDAQRDRFGDEANRHLIHPGQVFSFPGAQPGPAEPGPTRPTPSESPSPTPTPSESPSASESPTPEPSRTPGAQDDSGTTPGTDGAEQPRAPPDPSVFWVRALLVLGAAALVVGIGAPIAGGIRRWVADRDARIARRDARSARREALAAVSAARLAAEAADPDDRPARTAELVEAVSRASVAGASDRELARRARWSVSAVRVTVALGQGWQRLAEMPSGAADSPAERAKVRVVRELTTLAAELQSRRRAQQRRTQRAWRLLAELDALVRGTWVGLQAWTAAAERLGAQLEWRGDGSVLVTGAGPRRVRVPEVQVRVAQLGLAEQVDVDVPGRRVALEATAWVAGQLAKARRREPAAGVVEALAAVAEANPARMDDVVAVVEDVLAHNGGLAAARDRRLTPGGQRLVDRVAAEVEAAARRRTALHDDPAPAARRIRRQVERWGAMPAAERAAVLDRLSRQVAEQQTVFADVHAALDELVSAQVDQARAALKDRNGALRAARTAARQQDRGVAERRRKARVAGALAVEALRHTGRSADAYRAARAASDTAARSYEALAEASARGAETGELVRLAGAVERAVAGFREALAAAGPPDAAIPAGVPTGPFPFLDELTRSVNAELAAQRARRRYTAAELDAKLRASFRDVSSSEGVVLHEPTLRRSVLGWLLRQPRLPVAEVWVGARVEGVVEVARPTDPDGYGRQASEVMNGALPKGGFSAAVSAARSFGFNFGIDTAAVLDRVPVETGWLGAVKAWAASTGAKLGVTGSRGRNDATTMLMSGYALGGGVTDNRGPSQLYEGIVTWEVGVRGAGAGKWTIRDRVTRSADRSDPARPAHTDLLALWVSHAYQARAPPRTVQLPTEQRQETELPHHAPISVTGRQLLADKTIAELGDARGRVGDLTRAQVRAFLVDELPGRLGTAVNDPAGLERTVTDDAGLPLAHLVVRVRVEAIPTDEGGRSGLLIGLPTPKEFLEDLHVWFSSVGGAQSSGRSRGRKGSLSVGLPETEDGRVGPGASVDGGRSRSRSVGSSVGDVAIHPGVHRYSGHTQGYRLALIYTVAVRRLDERDRPETKVSAGGDAVLRMPEAAAYRYGLPVAARAVKARRADGTVRLRGDLVSTAPPGRRPEPPEWFGPGGVRDPGHALIRDMVGVSAVRAQVLAALRAEGLVPPEDPAEWPKSRRELAALLANQRAVLEHVTALTLETGYSQAVTSELALTLSDGSVLTTRLRQRWETIEYRGHTPAWTPVGLDIKSSTAGQSGSQSTSTSASGSGSADVGVGADGNPEPGVQSDDKVSPNAGGNLGWSHSAGRNGGGTGNVVTLVEGTGTAAVFRMDHQLVVQLHRAGSRGAAVLVGSGVVTADLLFPHDLLPDAPAYAETVTAPTTARTLRRMTTLALDAPGLLDQVVAAAEAQLPAGYRLHDSAAHQLREFANVVSLRGSLLELLEPGLRTRVWAVQTGTGHVRSVPVTLRGHVGDSTFVTAADMVLGDINLTLGSNGGDAGTSRSGGFSAALRGAFGWLPFVDSGSVNGSYSGSRNRSWSWLSIWGRERLGIEIGKQHVHHMGLRIDVEVGDARSATTVDGTVVYGIPARDAMVIYAETGERTMPLEYVSDSVQRYLQGDLALDGRHSHQLIPRYLRDLDAARNAGLPVRESANGHTPDALKGRLAADLVADRAAEAGTKPSSEAIGKALATRWSLRAVLAEGRRHYRKPIRAVLAEHYRTGMAESLFEDAELVRGGRETSLFGEVRDMVDETARGVFDRDGVAWSWLTDNLAGTRWRGHIDAMLGPDGFGTRLPVQVAGGVGSDRVDWVDVRIRARFTGDPILIGRTDTVIMLIQDYAYAQGGRSRAAGRNVGGGLATDGGAFGQGVSGSVSTDRSRTSSGDAGEQITTLRGLGSFDGANRIQHGIEFDITVERSAALPGLVPQRLRRGRVPAAPIADTSTTDSGTSTASRTVSGTVVRLVPDGLAKRHVERDDRPAPPARVVTSRPFRMPPQARLDARGAAELGAILRTTLADPRLLGRSGLHEHRVELHNATSPVALTSFLPLMVTDDGHFVGLFLVPDHPTQFVEVRLRARLYEEHNVVAGREAEIRDVHREENAAGVGETTGQLRPVGRGAGVSNPELGVTVSTSHGEQGSWRMASSGGLRKEKTLYEKGIVSTPQLRVEYELVTWRVTVRDGVVLRVRREQRVPAGAAKAFINRFDADHQLPYTGVRFGRTAPDVAHITRRSRSRWPVARWGPGPTVQTGGATYSSGGVGGALATGGGLRARAERGVLRTLPWHVARTHRVSLREEFPSLSHGLPVHAEIVTWGAGAVGALRRAGVRDPAERLIAFGWRHPVRAPDGLIVLFRHVLEEINSLVGSGRLDQGWFADLLAYETRFRIEGHTYAADGRSREAVAADLVERWERARRAGFSPAHRVWFAPVRAGFGRRDVPRAREVALLGCGEARACGDHRPLVDGDLDERRPGPVRWALDLGRTARAAVRRPVVDLRNRGPPRAGSTTAEHVDEVVP